MVKIAPSILAADFKKLEEEIKNVVECGADIIHVDVMDGKFVSNETLGMEMYKIAKQNANIPIDTHLMVENTEEWVDKILTAFNDLINDSNMRSDESFDEITHFIDDDIITFHVEAVDQMNVYKLIDKIHGAGLKAGIAIKPETELDSILPFVALVDMILIMTVEPGYGGQALIEKCLDKVKELRELEPNLDIEVDGGINLENIAKVKDSGANIIVTGTAIFNSKNRKLVIEKFHSIE